jgi:diguanylate cyclase (GGDEF)-like protein
MVELDGLFYERDDFARKQLGNVSSSAAFAAYNLDIRVTKSILKGFENNRIFNSVVIKDNFGDVLYAINNHSNDESYPMWLVNILKGDNVSYIELPLIIENNSLNDKGQLTVGSIQAQLNESDALNIVFRLLINTISYSIITTSFVVLIIYFLFRRLIGLPLASIIQGIDVIELYDSDKTNRLNLINDYQSTEFSTLVDAYNKSADRTSDYMQKLHIVTDELRSLSEIDPLTNAWNRRTLIKKLNDICIQSPSSKWMIIAADLDNFSQINDTYGHEMGDYVLKSFFQKVASIVPNNSVISRTGGDEFVILISENDIKSIDELIVMLAKLIKIPPGHPSITHHQYIETSFGISLFPDNGETPRDLLNCADLALYHSKNKGKRCIEIFRNVMFQASEQRIKSHRQLDELIESHNFVLFYQPKVRLLDGKIIGCEALLRLSNNINKAPFELIDSAEKSGLIIPLGSAILERAFSDFAPHLESFPNDFRMSVNVSTKQFEADDFLSILASLSSRYCLPLNRVDIEITESTQLDYSKDLATKRKWLKEKGCSFTLDDFGTGFASLDYLIRFSFDQVKIDKEFVKNLPNDENSQTINQVVKFLSNQFEMKIVAEGIETEDQEKWLQELGIDCGQGYLYAAAEPMNKLIERVENGRLILL